MHLNYIVHCYHISIISSPHYFWYALMLFPFFDDRKIRFLNLESFGELAPYMWGSLRFWVTLFMFLFTFWLRLYVHYVAQFLYLQVWRVLCCNSILYCNFDTVTVTHHYFALLTSASLYFAVSTSSIHFSSHIDSNINLSYLLFLLHFIRA